jgi:hypothetical protein
MSGRRGCASGYIVNGCVFLELGFQFLAICNGCGEF